MIPENFCINGEKLSFPNQKGFETIFIKEIISFESQQCGTSINCIDKDRVIVCQVSLAAFAAAFAPLGFFRIHHNCIINTLHVKDYNRTDGYRVLMTNGKCHHVSRNNSRDFEEVMLQPYRDLMQKKTVRGAKSTGYVSTYTICGILSNQLWLVLYIWQVISDTTPIESCLS